MKKLLGLTVAALMVMALVGGGTWAYFSDTETSTGNTFTAGTLDLDLGPSDTSDSVTGSFVFDNIYPTIEGGDTLLLNNDGTLSGYIDLSSISVATAEGTDPESETNNGTELDELLMVHIFFDVDGDGTFDNGEDTNIYGNAETFAELDDLVAAYDLDYALANDGDVYISLNYEWPSSANDNDCQGDIATLEFTVELDQEAD